MRFLKKLSTRWMVLWGILSLPLVFLLATGIIWLVENKMLLWWFIASAVISAIIWPAMKRLKSRSFRSVVIEGVPGKTWTKTGDQAWNNVEVLSEEIKSQHIYLESWANLWDLLTRVMNTVAKEFYPGSDNATLEVPVPYLLKVIELVACDLRDIFSKDIPGSHILTINDIIRSKRLASLGNELYNIYRVLSLGVTPQAAFAREVRDFLTGKVMTASTSELKSWVLQAYVKKIGYYSIELYSGSIVLDDEKFEQYTTKSSKESIQKFRKRDTTFEEEPLRILIAGEIKSGKSSLINGLFGKMKALVDVDSDKEKAVPYLLEREGMQRAVIFDTPGYQQTDSPFRFLRMSKNEILNIDLILMLCSAKTAARQADFQLLNELRLLFEKKEHEMPPIIIALTHIDNLRPFREWEPPYNVAEPKTLKEKMIRDAMDAISDDLNLDLSQVVPVNLKAERLYNIEEGLIPAILNVFDETNRLKYLRCLKEYKDEYYWSKLFGQTRNAGKLVVRGGLHFAGKVTQKIDKIGKEILP